MNYKLFDEFITLQALFKELGIIQSGGAIKAFLLENQVEVNGEVETRRGRKLRVGDTIEVIGDKEIVTITQPSPEEIEDYRSLVFDRASTSSPKLLGILFTSLATIDNDLTICNIESNRKTFSFFIC